MLEFTAGNLITIGVGIFNFVLMIMIKLNDLKHVEASQTILISKVGELSERISKMEGVCSVCTKKSNRRSK
jgi:hypothetical protein